MAKSYNLTMQLNLRGPSNLQRVTSNIRKQLSGAAALNLNIDKRAISSIDSATAKIKTLTQALNAGQKAADSMNASLSGMGRSLDAIKGSGSSASSSFRQIDKDLSGIESNMNKATAASESFGVSLLRKAKGVAAVRVLSSLTSELSSRFLQAASAAVEFERSLVKIRQITGSGSQSIGELGNTIRSLSKEFGVSANEMANVAVTLQQAGLSADQLNASLRTLAQASLSATFTNMTEATEGLIAALKQFKLQTKDIQPAIDAMNSVAGKFAVEFGDLVSAVQRGGGAFAAAAGGVRSATGELREGSESLNEYLGLFTSVRQTTRESAESISTALRTIGARLQQLSTQTSLEDIIGTKLELTKDGQFVGVYEAIGKISEALQKAGISAGDARFAQVAEQIGGIRQISKTIPLLTEYKVAQDAVAVANRANQQSAKEAALAQQTLANQLARTYEAWSDTASAFLNNTGLKTLVGLMLSLTRGAASFVKAFAPLAPIFAILGGAKLLKKFTAPKIPTPKGLGGLFGRNVSTAAGSSADQTKSFVDMTAASTRNTTAIERLTEMMSRLISSRADKLGFARGGVVPGSGRGDTVPAMLTPGEFVIRKDAVNAIGAENLHKMNKYGLGGEVLEAPGVAAVAVKGGKKDFISSQIGPRDLRKKLDEKQASRLDEILTRERGSSLVTWGLAREKVSEDVRKNLRKNLEAGIVQGTNTAVNRSAELLGLSKAPKITGKSRKEFLAGVNDGSVGNMFEQLLSSVENEGVFNNGQDPQRPFDFTNGFSNPALKKIFKIASQYKFIEARADMGATTPQNIGPKIAGLILGDEELNPIEEAKQSYKTLKDRLKEMKVSLASPEFLKRDLNASSGALKKELDAAVANNILGTKTITKDTAGGKQNFAGLELLKGYEEFARGGSVADTVPAMLTPGEFVINKKAAARIGASTLNKMNHADKAKGFNKGGPVGFVQNFADGGSARSLNSQIAVSTMEVKSLAAAQTAAEKEYLSLSARLKSMNDSLAAGIQGHKAYNRAVQIKIGLEQQLLAAEKTNLSVMQAYADAVKKRTSLIQNARELKTKEREDLAKRIANKKENVKAAFADAAQRRGVTTSQFNRDVKEKSKEQYLLNRNAIRDSRANLRSTLISGAARGLGGEKDREAFKGDVANQLESILGNIDPSKLDKVIADAMKEIDLGGSFQDIVNNVPEVAAAFDEAQDSVRALVGVNREVAAEFGGIVNEARITAQELAALEFKDKGGDKKFGGIGKVLDVLQKNGVTKGGSFEFSQTKIGQKIGGLNEKLSKPAEAIGDVVGKIPKIGPKLGGFVKSLGGLKAALGGLPGITSAAAFAIADRLIPSMDQIQTAEGAALAGGVKGGLSGATTGASLGFMVAGPVGAAVGAAVGGIAGAITGAVEAFRAKRLELALGKLNVSLGKLDQSFGNYDLTKSSESLQLLKQASKTAGADLGTVKGLAQFGNKRTVANWWAETLTLGLFNLRPGENEDKAMTAYINTSTKILDDINRMAQINAESQSIESLRRGQDQIRTGNTSAGVYTEAASADFGISPRDLAEMAAAKKLYDQFGDTEAARAAVSNLRNTSGKSGESRLVEVGNEELLARRLNAQEMAIQAQLNKQINVELENILNKYTQLNAAITRIRSDFDRNRNERQARTDYLGGNRRVASLGPSRDSDILKNPRGFNLEEFNAAADRTAALVGGGEIGKEVSDALKAQRTIAIDLPRILTQATSNNTQAVAEKFQGALEQGGLDPAAAKAIGDQVESALARQLGSGGEGSVSLQTLANEIGPLQSALQGMQEQSKFAEEVQSLWTEAVNESIQIVNEWGDALESSRERSLKATKAGIEGDLAIKNARGQRTSLNEKNASFLAEFDSLVSGNLGGRRGRSGNDLNLAAISAERASVAESIKGLRRELNQPGVKDPAAKTQQLGELQLKDERLRKALEHVADSTEMMDNALKQYAERMAKEDSSVDFLTTLATGGEDELAEINRSIYALNVALGDNVAEQNRLFATQEGRAAALKGAEYVAQAEGLSEQEKARLLATAQLRVFERTPGMDQLLDNIIGRNEDGTDRTVRQVLEERSDPNFVPPEILEAEAAKKQQIEANERLAKWQENRATELSQLVATPIIDAINKLPRLLAEALASLREKDILAENPVAPPGADGQRGSETPRETSAAQDRVFSGQTLGDDTTFAGRNARAKDYRLAYGQSAANLFLEQGDDFNRLQKAGRSQGIYNAALEAQSKGVSFEDFKKQAGLSEEDLRGANNFDELISQYKIFINAINEDLEKQLEKVSPAMKEYFNRVFTDITDAWTSRLKSENGLNPLPAPAPIPAGSPSPPGQVSEIEKELETLRGRVKHIDDIAVATDLTEQLTQERAAAQARIKELEAQLASGGAGAGAGAGAGGAPLSGGIDPSWVKGIADDVHLIERHTQASKESLGLVTHAVQEIAKAVPSFERLRSSIDALAATSIPLVLTTESTSILKQSNSIMENFNKDFGSYVTRLEQVAVKLPNAIEIKGRYTVDVNHNGAEVFASMKEDLSSLITCRVQRALYEASPDTVRPPTGECG